VVCRVGLRMEGRMRRERMVVDNKLADSRMNKKYKRWEAGKTAEDGKESKTCRVVGCIILALIFEGQK